MSGWAAVALAMQLVTGGAGKADEPRATPDAGWDAVGQDYKAVKGDVTSVWDAIKQARAKKRSSPDAGSGEPEVR